MSSDSLQTSLSLEQIHKVKAYIKQTWKTLSRSLSHLLEAAKDPKINPQINGIYPVYISPQEDINLVTQTIKQALTSKEFEQIDLRILPSEPEQITEHGLLYLPHDYVVPGGRFNEMYGWDSYFIVLGLLKDDEIKLAYNQVEQLLYEVEHYGTILNANRTYLLTRSQPPFLSQTILKLYEVTQDKTWLRSILPTIEKYYYYWTVPPHLNQVTGLSHYYDLGEGPAPEVIISERDEAGRTHYDRVKEYYRNTEISDYDIQTFYDSKHDSLTDLFYKGDRSMRESGLDITNRFGPFSVDIVHYAPVCLNCLLYQMEQNIAEINKILGHYDAIGYWEERAVTRKKLINHFFWDDEFGLYLDYNFVTNCRRYYPYLTTFYPLWTGIASEEQAQRIVDNLPLFEVAGGLRTSQQMTGNQWDAPFGWAPFQLIAVEGLSRYNFHQDARRIATKFIHLLVQEFEKRGTLLEKYDVEQCTANVSDEILFGYSSNEVGFGWTNGVFLELLNWYQT